MTAEKHDQGKPPMHLVPSEATQAAARAFGFGAEKYGMYNWCSGDGLEWSRLWSSVVRHLDAFWDGRDIDDESGLHALDHAMAAMCMLAASVQRGIGKDDRDSALDVSITPQSIRQAGDVARGKLKQLASDTGAILQRWGSR